MLENNDLLTLTTDIVSAHVSNNSVAVSDLPSLIRQTYDALSGLGEAAVGETAEPSYEPAVSIRKSLAKPDAIISMIDGKPYTMLKRHLSQHGLTPAQYRERYNLKADYPMVAESYSEQRRAMAHKIGLGQRGRTARAEANEGGGEKAKRTPRTPKSA